MAQALCEQIRGELHHIPSQKCTVEAIEKACHDCHYLPFSPGGFHVVLCDEADRMTPAAQLALLSKLDGTAFPPNTVFIFTCNETGNLEPRFLSRCRVIEFSSYGMAGEIASYLENVWHAEGGNGNAPDLVRLAKESRNNVRDALMRLETELLAL
jgi:DNA polymerase III delta prime subunit